MIPATAGEAAAQAVSLPWTVQLGVLAAAMWVVTKVVEMVIALQKSSREDRAHVLAGTANHDSGHVDTDTRIERLRQVQAEVLSTYLQGSVMPILARQTEILEGIRDMSGRHHEALTRLGFELGEMRAQQSRTHEGMHRLTNAVHELLTVVPKRRDDT